MIAEMVVVKETLGSRSDRIPRSHAGHNFDHPNPGRTTIGRRL